MSWRGFYCEHYAGKVLLFGPQGFIGSCRTPEELWGTLERSCTDSESFQREADQLSTRERTYSKRHPDLPTDPQDRARAIEDHIHNIGVTRDQSGKQKAARTTVSQLTDDEVSNLLADLDQERSTQEP